jgi:peroxiredoxin family protein
MSPPRRSPVPSEPLGILLISGGYERAHYAFVLATAAAAIGRPTVLFATNAGCLALATDFSTLLPGADSDSAVRASGVAGLEELRAAALDLGVRLLACEAGLRIANLSPALLMPGVDVAGVVTFLSATTGGQTISL